MYFIQKESICCRRYNFNFQQNIDDVLMNRINIFIRILRIVKNNCNFKVFTNSELFIDLNK